jgi:hypothetical protein
MPACWWGKISFTDQDEINFGLFDNFLSSASCDKVVIFLWHPEGIY